MSFPFRRRESNQYKHIAHGLIPAATVAPRSAVPRTPPPRSPNPSPERPRSALAAAILMTSLTGRTVAIPQPRQRAYSDNSSYIDESKQIEPYATATELGLEENWRAYAKRKTVSSPVLSLEFEDDDTEEQMSDTEREHIQQVSERKEESSLNDSLYAVPHKEREKHAAAVERQDVDGSGLSSPDVDNYSAVPEHLPTGGVPLAVNSSSPEPNQEEIRQQRAARQHLTSRDEQSAQVEEIQQLRATNQHLTGRDQERRAQVQEIRQLRAVNKQLTGRDQEWSAQVDELRQLRATNQHLTDRDRERSAQLEEMKQQIKAMRVKIKNLKNEKKGLEDFGRKSQGDAAAAELFSLREQAQELVDENDALKMTMHRLNVELSRYQTKYRPLSNEENVKIGGLPARGPPPPWLLDIKYLSPLLLAYEDRMQEKDDLIMSFEEEIKNFKVRVEKIIEENEELHRFLEQDRPVTNKEWELLQTQSKLLLAENRVLTEQLEVQEGKSREVHTKHLQEVSQLTKQLMVVEATKRNQEEELLDFQKQQEVLRSKYNELKANMAGRVAAEEHVAMVNELKSQLQQQRDNSKSEVHDLMDRIFALQAQKKALLLQRVDLLADNKTLEAEVETVKKSNRKMQRSVGQLKQQLEDAMEKEVTAHQYLANIITLAESIAGERDELIHVAKGLEAEKHGVLTKMMEGSVRLGRLEEMVKVYKKKAASTVQGITHRLTAQEDDFVGKAARYQREMKHLHWLLRDRQESLNEVLQQKRQVEGELEVIWESASNENKQLKALLHDALKPNASNAIIGCDFTYCNVNSSSHPG